MRKKKRDPIVIKNIEIVDTANKGKSIAILTNNTAINRNQKHILDI